MNIVGVLEPKPGSDTLGFAEAVMLSMLRSTETLTEVSANTVMPVIFTSQYFGQNSNYLFNVLNSKP